MLQKSREKVLEEVSRRPRSLAKGQSDLRTFVTTNVATKNIDKARHERYHFRLQLVQKGQENSQTYCRRLDRFIGNENGTSTSVELSIRGHWEWFPIKVF